MSTTEATVTTQSSEPEKPQSFREHYEAVKGAQSQDQDASAVRDDTSASKTAEDPDKVADQPTATTETPDALLTAEELAALPPKERARAEKWQAKLTREAQSLSARSKEFDRWKPLIDGDHQALEARAKELGFKLVKPEEQDTPAIPTELAFLTPIIERQVAPLREAVQQITTAATEAETKSTLEQFTAKYPDWAKHEQAMLGVMTKFVPAKGKVTDFEFMEFAYQKVAADLSKAETTKKIVNRINSVDKSVEPSAPGMSEKSVEHRMPLPEDRTLRRAYEDAKQGIRWAK